MASTDIVAGAVTRSELIHEAFVLAGLLKSGRSLSAVEMDRGEFHLHSLLVEHMSMRGGRLPSTSIMAHELAARVMFVFSVDQAEVNLEREEETLP